MGAPSLPSVTEVSSGYNSGGYKMEGIPLSHSEGWDNVVLTIRPLPPLREARGELAPLSPTLITQARETPKGPFGINGRPGLCHN